MRWAPLLFGALLLMAACRETPGTQAQVVLYRSGVTLHPEGDSAAVGQMVAQAESLYSSASERMKQIVSEQMVAEIKNGEALEIIFPAPQPLPSQLPGPPEKPLRLLVPLSGEWVGREDDPSVVIFCGFPRYSSGPVWARKGVRQLQELVGQVTWTRE